jgi:hypothetical protein
VEELSDGRLVAREEQQVWQHVQARERSPFAAQEGDSETTIHRPAGLSSLLGADHRVFGSRDDEEEGDEAPEEHIEPAEDGAGEADEVDPGRWARPRD